MGANASRRRRGAVVRMGLLASCSLIAWTVTSCSPSTSTSSTSSTGSSVSIGGSATVGTQGSPGTAATSRRIIVFNGAGNNLDAYEPDPPFRTQRVNSAFSAVPPQVSNPDGTDINAQICFFPDGSNRFVAGEDKGQSKGDLQGWGIFELSGDRIGELKIAETAKLVPTYQVASDNAENYGCGFLRDGRILTTDIGDQALGPANGQLIVWFPPFDSHEVAYCKIDVAIATAQSIYVDANDNIYVASARPAEQPDATAAGVFKYSGRFPTSNDASGGCGRKDATEKVLSPGQNGMLSPAGIVPSPSGGFYVSSVATGVINEYDAGWSFVRTILKPPDGEVLGPVSYATGTPLGMAIAPDGTIFYADIGVVIEPGRGIGPGSKTGSVRRITFTDGMPNPPDTMAKGLDFPDGIGIWIGP